MSDLKALKARIDILEVLKKIGARTAFSEAWDEEVQVWCPFCDDAGSDRPAARANPFKGLYFCYACGMGGTIIDIAAAHLRPKGHGLDIGNAIDWLEKTWPEEEKEDEDPWSG